jgi:hypothetical protein
LERGDGRAALSQMAISLLQTSPVLRPCSHSQVGDAEALDAVFADMGRPKGILTAGEEGVPDYCANGCGTDAVALIMMLLVEVASACVGQIRHRGLHLHEQKTQEKAVSRVARICSNNLAHAGRPACQGDDYGLVLQ